MKLIFNKSKGAVSGTILVLAVILIVIIIVVFVVIKITASKSAAPAKTTTTDVVQNQPPVPVYQSQLGDVDFTVISAIDLGDTLLPKASYGQKLTTTEKFIQVTIGAQNKGKNDTASNVWAAGNIVDSEGRNFISINNKAYAYLPQPNLCGSILKPVFAPTSCVMLYEVAKASTGLKVEVIVTAPKKAGAFLDLNVQ